jgi:hypothetical protein
MMEQPKLPTFSELLTQTGIDPKSVLVMRHRPREESLNFAFDSVAAEHPELFNHYQSFQSPREEGMLKRAKFLAAFIRHGPTAALFVGLYQVKGFSLSTRGKINSGPDFSRLAELGMGDYSNGDREAPMAYFDLAKTQWGEDFGERLVIDWPGGARSWARWADRNVFNVRAITEESLLHKPTPHWTQMCPSHSELQVLPSRWQSALKQWRGVYVITDTNDGMKYVGSAYGQQNILQRWLEYAETGHGGNIHLRKRDPSKFKFAILERASPDASAEEIITLEANWKARLNTLWPLGLNAN